MEPLRLEERILVVDDDPAYSQYLDLRLQQDGATTYVVVSGDDALGVLESFEPTMVIADVVLPGMDGLTLCRRIRSDARYRRLPVLILTSAEHSAEVGDVVGLGLIWYLRKGAEWQVILRSLRNLGEHAREVPLAS
jgi:two-component system alkaline phosphatase synthesis response regulator PhoP